FLPTNAEITSTGMLKALLPLRELTNRGVAVLLIHHPPKRYTAPGNAARGTGALSAFTDINLEMTGLSLDPADRRRRLLGFSRFDETPRKLTIKLDEAGTDYRVLADGEEDDDFRDNWETLRMVLDDAADKRTRQELLDEWPADFERPHPATLHRWLSAAV